MDETGDAYTFVAVGDSFTEGLEDARDDGRHRGWADLVADHLATVHALRYANLAVRGRRIEHVLSDQLPLVEDWRPDLATLAIGGNDLTGLRADIESRGREFDAILSRMVAASRCVVTFAGFDPRFRIPLSQTVSDRARDYNAWVRGSAISHGALLVDLWRLPRMYEPQMWAQDRLHMSAEGHRLIAREVLRVIGEPVDAIADIPEQAEDETSWWGRRRDESDWARSHFAPWVWRASRGRSSGDGVDPKLPEPVDWPIPPPD